MKWFCAQVFHFYPPAEDRFLADAGPFENGLRGRVVPDGGRPHPQQLVYPIHAQSLRQALAENPQAEFWFREDFAHGQLSPDYQTGVKEFFHKHL